MAIAYFIESFLALLSVIALNAIARNGWVYRSKAWHRFIFFFIMSEVMLTFWLFVQGLEGLNIYVIKINEDILALVVRGVFAILGIPYYFYKKSIKKV